MSLTLDLQKYAAKAGARMDEAVGRTITAVVAEVDARSPVDTGRFRGNWQLGVGFVPSGKLADMDPTGTGTVSANIARIPEDAGGKVYYLANNLEYAIPLEYGHSRQAPGGMVRLTAQRWQQIVDQAAGEAKAVHP